ncbi:bifunctional lysylphosphatidylglycerol flippase/synthetase MprF [Pseudaminobacter sp. 19-2017]|uniref:Bifunctional lysylphosphatidylglycerol flippase/synthetase MprF n=1 Tax=Pseudaminobacter soli (ex Zhang et al. 2022) TaxID=2831468 RepID=A0A942I3A9_9HYPH|nr:bifunctional lysylphosphatidylglycerol flippase/synthetase MprF [Pseudaminobacter soli]
MSPRQTAAESQKVESAFARPIERLVEPHVLGPAVGALAVAIALYVIHQITAHLHLNDIVTAVSSATAKTILPALGFTAISFLAMSLYDVLAVRRVAPGRIPLQLAVFAGMVGYGFSTAIGFHVFVGGLVRYRIYQTAGLDAADVGRIVGISLLTFSGGLAAILGITLLLDPTGVRALQFLSPADDRIVGVAILALLLAAILWLRRGNRIIVLGWTFLLPAAPSAAAQLVIGAVDIGAAAAALYVLLPPDIAPGFASFLILFVAAIIASVVSHAPGGLGVLEATILYGLGAGTRPDVVAALVLFRLIYYALPLGVAVLGLGAFEIYRVRMAVAGMAARTLVVVRRMVPPVASVLVFGGGLVLVLSSNTPTDSSRMAWLEDVLPLPFAEASHLLASITGVLLIVIARGLYRRIASARIGAILLLLSGATFSLLKGIDWEEALLLTVLAGALATSGPAFYRKGDWRSFRPDLKWISLMAIALASLTLVGFLAFRHVEYQSSLWWEFAWDGDAPRFLRATLALTIVAGAIAADAVINRPMPMPPRAGDPIPAAVRTILDTSTGTQPCIALLGDKFFLVSDDGKAFLMYAVSGSSWIAMGDPVGDPQSGIRLIWRFAEAADRAGARSVYYAVQPEFLTHYLDMGLALLKIGEVARVPLAGFSLAGPARQPLRYAEKRGAREGLVFSVVSKANVPAILEDLRAVSDAWLEEKHHREKGFSLGFFDDRYMGEFDCAVMRKEGVIIGFANLWRSGDHVELSIDLMRYRPGVSRVLMDALFVHLLLYGRDQGYQWFNLGAAPLAGLADHPLASTWNRVGTFIFRRGDEFYNFEGLRDFKQKFDPVWTPQYLACPGGLGIPQVLLDVTTLISRGPLGLSKR